VFNGDIAIQWEWSNFDPSQNPNPLTDYDKTLHNWLRSQDEHVTKDLCQSVVRERLAEYVKYNTKIFIYFFSGSPTEVTRWWISSQNGLKDALSCKDVPFGGLNDDQPHLGGPISW